MIENKDYMLVPTRNTKEKSWTIRILTGEFVDTYIQFGKVAINEETESINFNFVVTGSPNPSAVVENPNLQETTSKILQNIIDNSLSNGYFNKKEK